MNVRARTAWRVVRRLAPFAAIALAVAFAASHTERSEWSRMAKLWRELEPDAGLVVASCSCVLALYAVQIYALRALLGAWGGRLPYLAVARVWSVSNLARFAPASALFTTGALSALASRAGLPAVAAAAAAVFGTVVNAATGAALAVGTGANVLPKIFPHAPRWSAVLLLLVGIGGVAAAPLFIRSGAAIVSRLTGRDVQLPALPARVVLVSVTANVVSWLLYGAAFRWLALALFPDASGEWGAYVAVFTAAYLLGWVTLVTPGGLGVREVALQTALVALKLLSPAEAATVILASRLILTVLEILPGAAFLARDGLSRGR